MIRTLIPTLLMSAVVALPAMADLVTFDFAHVGNAGNAADPQTGYGAVSYNYAISKTEVTNAQYTKFLNAVDPTGANALALYFFQMADNFGGIELQAGNADGSKFVAQAGREQNPVTLVSFLDAVRFTNWLHNGQGPFGSPSGDTETGAYTIGNGANVVRSADARYWIPSENEWYKAAYHDASAGTAGVYFDYATGSDITPLSDQPGDNPAAANYFTIDTGYAVSGNLSFPTNTNPFTDVGAYTDAASPYGTFDQNGNVYEWNEAVIDVVEFGMTVSQRGIRGGSWIGDSIFLRSDSRSSFGPTSAGGALGFRVATTAVPEPGTLLVWAVGIAGLLLRRRS